MEINKYISKKAIIYICILIVILIIFRILYSTIFSNEEGFDLSDGPAADLLSKVKSTDAQDIVNPNNNNIEMQIYSWSNQLYNLQNLSEQSKPIAFYKPNLTLNNTAYAKLGDIVSQNTDYNLPGVDQFTLLIKKNTSDIKPPIRFDLMAVIDNASFNPSYYNFSNYIGRSVNFNVITDSLANCASSIDNLNTLIQNNLTSIQNNFAKKIYTVKNITIDSNTVPILKIINDNNGEVVEGFDSDTVVDTGYTDFIPTPLITTPNTNTIPKFNLKKSNNNFYKLEINITSSLSLPAGTTAYISIDNPINDEQKKIVSLFTIPSTLDSAQDANSQNILNKLNSTQFSSFRAANVSFVNESQKIFSYIPAKITVNYIISLCNDIENIYNNQSQSTSSIQSKNLLLYLKLAPNIDTVKNVLRIMSSNKNNINTMTFENIISQLPQNLILNTLTSTTTLLELVLYIMNNMMISYKLTYLNFTPNTLNDISKTYNDFLKYQKSFVNPPLIADPVYAGCYIEKDTVEDPRAVPNDLGGVSTVNQCAQLAQNTQYTMFALQNGGRCWGGNNMGTAKKYGESTKGCAVLGGSLINQLYYVQQVPPMQISITQFDNDIISNIPSSTYNIMTNSLLNSSTTNTSIMNSIVSNISNFSEFAKNFSENIIGYFPLQIYKPIAPDNYMSLGHVFCNIKTDLKKIIDSNNVACVPSHCVKPIRDWTLNDKIFEYNKDSKYFAIYFNPYTGTFICTNTNAQQLPEGKVCKVVACVKKCTAVEDLQKADDCARKYYNLNKTSINSTPLSSKLVSNQEEEFYLNKLQAQSESITRLKKRAQNMQTTVDKANIVNREMNKNKLQDYVDVQKQNIDIIMKRLQDDKNKIQTNINIPSDTLKSIMDMIKNSSSLSSDQKTTLLSKITSSQNLPDSQYNKNLNQILSSCPEYDLSGLVSKQTASDVCYGCDAPK